MPLFDDLITSTVEFLQDPNNKNLLLVIVTIIATFLTFKKDKAFDVKRERFEKLISPLYFMIEPYMYQKIDSGSLNNIIDFIEKNRLHADANLIERARNCKKCPTHYNFEQLCLCIDILYDKYSLATSLKIRSINYRLNQHLYKSKFTFVLYILIASIQGIRIPAFFYTVFFVFIFLPTNIVENFLHVGIIVLILALLSSIVWLIYDYIKSRRKKSEYSNLF